MINKNIENEFLNCLYLYYSKAIKQNKNYINVIVSETDQLTEICAK